MQNTTFSQTNDTTHLAGDITISISIAVIFLTNICVNSGILVFLWKNKYHHVGTNAIVAATSGNDLLLAGTCVLAQWISSCLGYWAFDDRLSYITAFCFSFCRTFGALCVTFLVVVRYLSLRHFSWAGPRNRTVYLFLLSSAIASLVGAVPGYDIFDEKTIPYGECANMTQEYVIECCIYSSNRGVWILYQTIFFRLIPFTVALFSCIKIIITSAKLKMKLTSSFGTNDQIRSVAETEHAFPVVILVFIHIVCQLPLCINEMYIMTLKKENGILLAHPFLALLSWSNSAINPVVYLVRSYSNLPSLVQRGKCCLPILDRCQTYNSANVQVGGASNAESTKY